MPPKRQSVRSSRSSARSEAWTATSVADLSEEEERGTSSLSIRDDETRALCAEIYQALVKSPQFDPGAFGCTLARARVMGQKAQGGFPNENFARKTLVPLIAAKSRAVVSALRRPNAAGAIRASPHYLMGGYLVLSEAMVVCTATIAFSNPLMRVMALARPPEWWSDLFETLHRVAVCVGVASTPLAGDAPHPEISEWLRRCFEDFSENARIFLSASAAEYRPSVDELLRDPSMLWVFGAFAGGNPHFIASIKAQVLERTACVASDAESAQKMRSLVFAVIAVCTLDVPWVTIRGFVDAIFHCIGGAPTRDPPAPPTTAVKTASPCELFEVASHRLGAEPTEPEMLAMCAVWNYMEQVSSGPPELDQSQPDAKFLVPDEEFARICEKVGGVIASLPPELDLGLRSREFGLITTDLVAVFLRDLQVNVSRALKRSVRVVLETLAVEHFIGALVAVSLVVEGVASCASASKSRRNVRHCAQVFLGAAAADLGVLKHFFAQMRTPQNSRLPFLANDRTVREVFRIRELLERRGDWSYSANRPVMFIGTNTARAIVTTAAAVLSPGFARLACERHRSAVAHPAASESADDSVLFACANYIYQRAREFSETRSSEDIVALGEEGYKQYADRQKSVAAMAAASDRFL